MAHPSTATARDHVASMSTPAAAAGIDTVIAPPTPRHWDGDDLIEPSSDVLALLDEPDRDATCIFGG